MIFLEKISLRNYVISNAAFFFIGNVGNAFERVEVHVFAHERVRPAR